MARSYVREARRRGLGRRRERIGPIVERLAVEHADAEIALRFESDVELLISVMLSAQTTDANVNRVTQDLFRKYRRPEDYLAVPVEELERDVFATGFYRQKAKAIRGAMRVLIDEFDGEVPRTIPELLRLPGVARKTANVVASELGHAQGIVVDTHVRRLSQRLGLTREDDPVKIERDLVKVVPHPDWARFPHLLIWHGRRVCDARRPRCEACVLADLCPSARVELAGQASGSHSGASGRSGRRKARALGGADGRRVAMGRMIRRGIGSWATLAPPVSVVALALAWTGSPGTAVLALLAVLLASAVLAAVHHAEVVVHRVGTRFGSLVLAICVTVIEVALIVTLRISAPGDDASSPARDTVFAAVMITCSGILGLSILVGALRSGVVTFNAERRTS